MLALMTWMGKENIEEIFSILAWFHLEKEYLMQLFSIAWRLLEGDLMTTSCVSSLLSLQKKSNSSRRDWSYKKKKIIKALQVLGLSSKTRSLEHVLFLGKLLTHLLFILPVCHLDQTQNKWLLPRQFWFLPDTRAGGVTAGQWRMGRCAGDCVATGNGRPAPRTG